MKTNIHALLIEDDKNDAIFTSSALKDNGCHVITASSGAEGLSLTASLCPDIILLDLNLPDLNGYEIIKRVRSWSNIPIIVISAHNEEPQKVTALDLGADDYITKPFGKAELAARVRTSLRRIYTCVQSYIYKAHELEINFEKRLVYLKGKPIHLTQNEYQLLTLLAEKSGQVLTYHYLMSHIWGPYIDNNNQILRVNMANIRRKIEKNPARPEYVFTEIGIGYRMLETESD